MNDATPEQIDEQFHVASRELASLLALLRNFRSNPTAYKSLPVLGKAISDVRSMLADVNAHADRFQENLADEPVLFSRTAEGLLDWMPKVSRDEDVEPDWGRPEALAPYHDEDIFRGER